MSLLGAYQEIRKNVGPSGAKEANKNIAKILEDNSNDIIELVNHLGDNLVKASLVKTINDALGSTVDETTIIIAQSFLSDEKLTELKSNKDKSQYKELPIGQVKKYKTTTKKLANGKTKTVNTKELELDENGNEMKVPGKLHISYWGRPSISLAQIERMLKNHNIEL